MSRDTSRDHFMTKAERDQLWREYGAKRDAERAQAARERGPSPVERDYEVVVRDGREWVVCPWGQELAPLGSEVFFWNVLEELREHLSDEGQARFHALPDVPRDDPMALVMAFCDWALDGARARARERYLRRVEEVEDVREAVGYYEGD